MQNKIIKTKHVSLFFKLGRHSTWPERNQKGKQNVRSFSYEYDSLTQKGGMALLVEEKSEQSGQNCILRPFRTKSPIYFAVSKTQSDNFR